jgi:hypothetical protein
MSFAAVLLVPFALLFPAAGVIEAHELQAVASADLAGDETPDGLSRWQPGQTFREMAESFRVQAQHQLRIEQHMSIRIAPSGPMTRPPNIILDFRQREIGPRLVERKIGKCIPVSGIAAVKPDMGNRLILFMRDRRMISAQLERACRGRDFYSGFYVDRTPDGQLCVDRDTLLSRSGANCKVSRIRQLVEPDE